MMLGNIILLILGSTGVAFILFMLISAIYIERKDFNNGICPYCGDELHSFGCDSSDAEGWKCNSCDYTTWVSYKKLVYRQKNRK